MQQGVIRRSPFYDLPYFSMSMVQYDLMHTAAGVLTTFNKGYSTVGHPLFVKRSVREEVPPSPTPPHSTRPHSPARRPRCVKRFPSHRHLEQSLTITLPPPVCDVLWVLLGGEAATASTEALAGLPSQGLEASHSNEVPTHSRMAEVGSW